MGDQAYAYRGHSYDSDEEWKSKNYGRNPVGRTVIYDSNGRKISSINGASAYCDTETYIVETEITEHIRAPVGSEYRYSSGSPKRIEQKYRRPSSPYRSPEVDHFQSGVQVEASRPLPQRYGHSNGHDRKNGYGNGYGDYRKGHDYGGGYSSSDEDEEEDRHSYNYPRPEPEHVRNNGSSTRVKPGSGHGSKPGSLSMPTDSIEEAIEILKGGKKGEVGKHYGSSKPYGSSTEAVKPYGSGTHVKPYGSSTEAEKPYGSSTYAKPYGSGEAVKPYGSGEAVKPYGSSTYVKPYGSSTEAEKPYGSSTYVKPYGSGEAVRPYVYGSAEKPYDYGSSTTVKPYGYGSKTEDPYGSKNQTPTYPQTSTGNPQPVVIDCYEAAKRYNGKVIRT